MESIFATKTPRIKKKNEHKKIKLGKPNIDTKIKH